MERSAGAMEHLSRLLVSPGGMLPGVEAFQDRYFCDFCSSGALHHLLAKRRINRVWELREYGPEIEADVSIFKPPTMERKATLTLSTRTQSRMLLEDHRFLLQSSGAPTGRPRAGSM